MNTVSNFAIPITGFLLTLFSGVWLSHFGRPLNTFIFTVHKLIALAAVIITVMQIYNILVDTEIQSTIITLIVIAGLCVLALFASGAMMSIGLQVYNLLLSVHKAAFFMVAVSMVLIVYFLSGIKP